MKTPRIRIDAARHEVWLGDKEILLSPKEFGILSVLTNSGKTMSREQLRDSVWKAKDGKFYPRTIDQHVARLRRKLRGVEVVKTVSTHGYKIAV